MLTCIIYTYLRITFYCDLFFSVSITKSRNHGVQIIGDSIKKKTHTHTFSNHINKNKSILVYFLYKSLRTNRVFNSYIWHFFGMTPPLELKKKGTNLCVYKLSKQYIKYRSYPLRNLPRIPSNGVKKNTFLYASDWFKTVRRAVFQIQFALFKRIFLTRGWVILMCTDSA